MKGQFGLFVFAAMVSQLAFGETIAGKQCDVVKIEPGYKSGTPVEVEPEAIAANGVLFPGGRIQCSIDKDYSTKNYRLVRSEIGAVGKDNIKYRFYYSDGSGTIQGDPRSTLEYGKDLNLTNWSLSCRADRMDDTRWCALTKGTLQVGIWKDKSSFVSVGSEHYPGSDIVVRVDKSKPVSAGSKAGFSNAQSSQIIKEFSTGSQALVRYTKWPYQRNLDSEVSLYGFNDAYKVMSEVYGRHSQ